MRAKICDSCGENRYCSLSEHLFDLNLQPKFKIKLHDHSNRCDVEFAIDDFLELKNPLSFSVWLNSSNLEEEANVIQSALKKKFLQHPYRPKSQNTNL